MKISTQILHRLFTALMLIYLLYAPPSIAGVGGDFSLTDQNGDVFRLSDSRGKVVLLFFGYTYCPDICPTELAKISFVLQQLEKNADDIHCVFVSVDPSRDSTDLLTAYVQAFDSRISGVTGTENELASVASQYGISYTVNQLAGANYTVDHTANFYIIDKLGKLAIIVPYGFPLDHLVNSVQGLL